MNDKKQKRSAVIFPSQLELIQTLPKNQQLEVLYALFDYELYGKEPKASLLNKSKFINAIWITSKPLIDKRVKWAENGRKGGLAKGKNSKSKANRKQTDSKRKADKDMDMDMDMEYTYPSSIEESQEAPPLEDDDWSISEWCEELKKKGKA